MGCYTNGGYKYCINMEKVVETGCYLVHFLLLPECGHHQFVDYSATFWMRMPKKNPNFIYIEFEF
jgi:hypothetical protein